MPIKYWNGNMQQKYVTSVSTYQRYSTRTSAGRAVRHTKIERCIIELQFDGRNGSRVLIENIVTGDHVVNRRVTARMCIPQKCTIILQPNNHLNL